MPCTGATGHLLKPAMKTPIFLLLLPLALFSCGKDEAPRRQPDCPTGYTGSECHQQLTPTGIWLAKIDVLEFPAVMPSGAPWDGGNGPDLYLRISRENSHVATTPVYSDAVPGSMPTILLDQPFKLDAERTYQFALYDLDPIGENPLMGTISGPVYSPIAGFPAVLQKQENGVKLKLHVTYTW